MGVGGKLENNLSLFSGEQTQEELSALSCGAMSLAVVCYPATSPHSATQPILELK